MVFSISRFNFYSISDFEEISLTQNDASLIQSNHLPNSLFLEQLLNVLLKLKNILKEH